MRTADAHERAAFVRWIKRNFPNVSTRRCGKPAQDQYIVPAVQEAWQGWQARSEYRPRTASSAARG